MHKYNNHLLYFGYGSFHMTDYSATFKAEELLTLSYNVLGTAKLTSIYNK